MKKSVMRLIAVILSHVFCCSLSSADAVERHWEFDSVKSISIGGQDIRIIADDVPVVTLSCLDSSFTPDSYSPTGIVSNNLLTIVPPSVERRSATWTLRIPRQLELDLITGSCQGEVWIKNIRASYLNMITERQYLRLDNCDIDSLQFSSNERNMDMTSGVIRQWARIKTPRTIHVTLRSLPDDLLYLDTWSVELFIKEIGESYCFEIPDAGGNDISSEFFKCTHEMITNPDSLEHSSMMYCIGRKGTGKPKVIGSPAIEHFFCTSALPEPSDYREVHKSWTFDSVASLSVWGDDVRILADNSSSVRVSFTSTILRCEKDQTSAILKDGLLELTSRGSSGKETWLIRVPRQPKLDRVACYFNRSLTVSDLKAVGLTGKGGMSWMSLDSCEIDSLYFDAFEGGFTSKNTTVAHYAFIKAAEPTQVSLTRPPDRFLQCQAEELYLHFDTMGDAFQLQIPVQHRNDCSINMPFTCDSAIRSETDSSSHRSTEYCIVSRGKGGPRILIGPYVFNFHMTVGSSRK